MTTVDTPSHPLAREAGQWGQSTPAPTGAFERDAATFSDFWRRGGALLDKLPAKARRDAAEQALAQQILEAARAARTTFMKAHAAALYDALTDSKRRHVRVEVLAYEAAKRVPGLVPTQAAVDAESQLMQKDKDGHEIDQGILFSHFLGNEACGMHLCHAMLLPRQEALELRERLARDGRIDLGTAIIERSGLASTAYMKNPRYLNAEDDTTVHNVEIAVDLALLDPETSVAVLRGATIEGGKYDGKNVFCTGINLTELYRGNISYLWYLVRDLGFINKMYRGLAHPDVMPDDVTGTNMEKPWIAVLEKFAIGGGCQYLLSADYILAGSDGYITLPARKEGIIPGPANMRLIRFVGDRLARHLVMNDKRLDCNDPEGKLIFDEVVAPERIDEALQEVITRMTTSGVVSTSSNRSAFRVAQEPLDLYRRYMAVYAREQAYCHFSPALIRNLERFWNADKRAA